MRARGALSWGVRCAGAAQILAAAAAVVGLASGAARVGGDRLARADDHPLIPAFSAWTGSYVCAQGTTALRLSLVVRGGSAAIATFEFGPHPDNPKLPSGEFLLTGTVRLLSRGQLQVKLVPDRWITRPGEGWQMVGLSATSDPGQRLLSGHIDAPGCGELQADRETGT